MTERTCQKQVFRGRISPAPEPPEFCDSEAEPFSDFCAEHDPDTLWDLADQAFDAMREGYYD